MRYFRILRIAFTILLSIPVALFLVAALLHPEKAGGLLAGAIVPLFLIAAMNLSFYLMRRAFLSAQARLLTGMREIAARAFDAPGQARDDFDGAPLLGGFGDFIRIMDGARWPAAEGTSRGAHVLVTSHASYAGRQMFEAYHVYSYVAVDVPGFGGTFRLTERSKIVNFLLPGARDVKIGDPAFEAGWVVDADENVARAALTDAVRARLVDLRSKVGLVSIDFAQGRMTVGMTPRGLTLRWPGELTVELTDFIRDVLLDMRAGLMTLTGAQR